ncbi:MAG: hypothetical protein AB7I27_11165 [Bacteriovoracaceae bacterium]
MANTLYSNREDLPLQNELTSMHPLISWRSVLAGLLITFFTFIGLAGLGVALGGISMNQEVTAKGVGLFSGIWFLGSVLISLFVGSYFAARVSKFRANRIGSAQGLVIAALFIGFIIYQVAMMIGVAGNIVGDTASVVSTGVQKAGQNPMINNTISNIIEDSFTGLNLKSDAQTVATGLGSRLVRGDVESAKNYLSAQAGISPAEADQRIVALRGRVDNAIAQAKDTTSMALQSSGWTLFLLVVLGALAAVAGGALGSVANFRKPLTRVEYFGKSEVHA